MATVLIAEDNPDNSALLTMMLEHAGHTVVATADGLTALKTALAIKPDVVVLDGKMPGMSGVEVCRALKNDPITADLPVIFVTASVDEAHIEAALSAGADTYITKPFSRREFLTCVEMVIEGRIGDVGMHVSSPSNLATLATHGLRLMWKPVAAS